MIVLERQVDLTGLNQSSFLAIIPDLNRRETLMSRKTYATEEIARTIGVHAVTLEKWKREFGGLQLDQAKRLKELEKENARLKKIVADQALDNSIMKERSKNL